MDLLKDLKMSLLNFSFAMTYIIHKMLVLLKDHPNFLNVVFSNAFLRSMTSLYFFKKIIFFHNI